VFVHHINPDTLLLIIVDAEGFREGRQPDKIIVRNLFAVIIETSEQVSILTVFPVDELDEKKLGLRVFEEGEDFLDNGVVIFFSHGKGALDRFPQESYQFLLLSLQGTAEMGRVDEEEIIADRIAVEEDFVIAQGAFGPVGKLKSPVGFSVVGAIHGETVQDITLGQVGERLIDAEHVFAEGTTVSPVADSVTSDDEFVARRKKADLVMPSVTEAVRETFADVRPCQKNIIFYIFFGYTVQAYVFPHLVLPCDLS
jgi:hypothetical protein